MTGALLCNESLLCDEVLAKLEVFCVVLLARPSSSRVESPARIWFLCQLKVHFHLRVLIRALTPVWRFSGVFLVRLGGLDMTQPP